jgi:ketosteroid isomerase-like protein
MTTSTSTDQTTADPRWAVAGEFIDALTRRDFSSLADCLAPDVRFRALVPPGPFELSGSTEVGEKFRAWFGSHPGFAVLDAGVGQIGSKLYLTWRLWCRFEDGIARTVEQQAYAKTDGRITDLDLLCSGFQAEASAEQSVAAR